MINMFSKDYKTPEIAKKYADILSEFCNVEKYFIKQTSKYINYSLNENFLLNSTFIGIESKSPSTKYLIETLPHFLDEVPKRSYVIHNFRRDEHNPDKLVNLFGNLHRRLDSTKFNFVISSENTFSTNMFEMNATTEWKLSHFGLLVPRF